MSYQVRLTAHSLRHNFWSTATVKCLIKSLLVNLSSLRVSSPMYLLSSMTFLARSTFSFVSAQRITSTVQRNCSISNAGHRGTSRLQYAGDTSRSHSCRMKFRSKSIAIADGWQRLDILTQTLISFTNSLVGNRSAIDLVDSSLPLHDCMGGIVLCDVSVVGIRAHCYKSDHS